MSPSAADRGAATRLPGIDPWQTAPFWAILALALLFGGASRAGSMAQIVVRLGAVLILGWAVLADHGHSRSWRGWPLPFRLLALLGGWMALQLVPLPPALWQLQPGAAPYAAALEAAGLSGTWHGLSLSPDLTLNSLFALLPLLVLGTVASGLRLRELRTGLAIVFAAAALSVLIEVGQLAGAMPPLHRVSNPGSDAGLFANRNHHAALLCCTLPLLGAWASGASRRSPRPWIALGCGLLVLPLVLATGSRGGLMMAVLAGVAGLAIGLTGRRRRSLGRPFWLGLAGAAAAVAALTSIVLLSGRDRAIGRLLASGDGSEIRFQVLGTLTRIVRDFLWAGAGFGTFDPIFRGYEPQWALKPTYLNHAHNDLIELAMEGGLPALALLVAFLVWAARRSVMAWRKDHALPRAASMVLGILLVWSLFDYPLRTPALGVLAGWCVLLLAGDWDEEAASNRSRPTALGKQGAFT